MLLIQALTTIDKQHVFFYCYIYLLFSFNKYGENFYNLITVYLRVQNFVHISIGKISGLINDVFNVNM